MEPGSLPVKSRLDGHTYVLFYKKSRSPYLYRTGMVLSENSNFCVKLLIRGASKIKV